MALRVLLVGLVAGLGFSLPTGEQIAHWRDSAHVWVTARLAAWDAQMPAGEDAYVYVTDSAIDADRVAPALVADEPTPTVTPDPNPTPAPIAPAVATIAPEAPAPTQTTSAAGAMVEPEWTKDLIVPTAPTALDESEILPEPQPEPAPVPVLATPALALDTAFDAALSDVVATFAADLATPRPPAEAPTLLAETVAAPKFDPIAVDDNLDCDTAYALNRAAEGFDIPSPAPAVELITVADDLADDVAYTLNRQAEGLVAAPAQASPPATTIQAASNELSVPSDRLSHAMRLTREAVFAWAKVLHAPAVVTISH